MMDFLTSPTVLAFLLFLFVFLYVRGSARAWPNAPPSPFRLPLLGNLIQFTSSPHLTIPGLVQQFGSIFTIFAGADCPMVLVNSSSLIKPIFKGSKAADRPPTGFNMYFDEITREGRNLSWARFSPRLVAIRKMIASSIVSSHGFKRWDTDGRIRFSLEKLEKEWENQINKQQSTASSKASGKAPFALINPEFFFKGFSMSVISSIVFGKSLSFDDPLFKQLNHQISLILHVLGAGNPRDAMHFLRKIPDSSRKEISKQFDEFLDFLTEQLKDHIKARQQRLAENGQDESERLKANDFIDELLIARESSEFEEKQEWLNDQAISLLLLDLFVAGTDTTAVTMTWAVFWAAKHPEAQQKAREEIDRVVGKRQVVAEDRDEMPYCRAFLNETMRIWPVGPLAIPHTAHEDIEVNDKGKSYHLPKDTVVCMNVQAIHRSKETWGADAEQFRPERFLTATPDFLETNFLPFGYGIRKCPGSAMAERELFLAFVGILQHFLIFPPDDSPLKESLQWGLALTPKPFQIKIIKRTE